MRGWTFKLKKQNKEIVSIKKPRLKRLFGLIGFVFKFVEIPFTRISKALNSLRFYQILKLFGLEGLYVPHTRVRLIHDKIYRKGGWYKKYSDSPISVGVHKATVFAFIISFIIFSGIQNLWPYLFTFKPQNVQAGATTKIWDTSADFTDNNGATGNITSTNIDSNSGNPKITSSPQTSVENTTAQFNLGTRSKTVVGTNSVTILKPDGASATSYTECASGFLSSNSTCGGYAGLSATALEGKMVSKTNDSNASRANGSSACAAKGGRLPTKDELLAIYANKASYGNNYNTNYWSGTSAGGGYYWYVNLSTGSSSSSLDPSNSLYIRCVDDGATAPTPLAGTFTSQIKDNSFPTDYTTASWTKTLQSSTWIGTGLISDPENIEFRAGVDNNPNDGGWTDWASVLNGGSISSFNGNQYFQYRVTLNTSSISYIPTLNSVTVGYNSYTSPATLGGVAASNIGLRIDAETNGGVGAKVKAASLSWNATTPATGQKVLFKVRAGDTQDELDENLCYGPSASDSGCADWSTAGKFFSQINGQENSGTGVFAEILNKRYVEVLVRLESSGGDSPTLNSVTLGYDSLEAPNNSNATPYKTDGTTLLKTNTGSNVSAGSAGGYTNEDSLKLTVTGLTCGTGENICIGSSTNRRLEVEAKKVGTAFDGTGLVQGDSAGTETVTSVVALSALESGFSYHLRMRTIDNEGHVSGWTNYGGNTEEEADFSVESVLPVISSVTLADASDDGMDYTNNATVNVTLAATDSGGSALAQMSFSGSGETWSEWETYSTTKSWDVTSYGGTPEDGDKKVYVRVRDNAGNISGQNNLTSEGDWNGTTQGASTTYDNTKIDLTTASGSIKLKSFFSTGYNYQKEIVFDTTIQGANVATNQTNFPVAVNINASSWPNATERSNFFNDTYNPQGKRINFYDADGTTRLAYEVEHYDTAAQEAIYWVKVPQLDGNSATDKIVLGYGNDPNESNQDQATSVWDTDSKGIYHLANGTSLSANDSTSNANNGTVVGPTASAGVSNGGATWDTVPDDYISLPNNFNSAAPLTYETWIKDSSETATDLFSLGSTGNATLHNFGIGQNYTSSLTNELITVDREAGGDNLRYGYVTANRGELFDGNWHHVVLVYSGASTSIYLDGVPKTVTVGTGSNNGAWGGVTSNDRTTIGAARGQSDSGFLNGTSLDEIRISTAARSDDWVKLAYYSNKKIAYNGDSYDTATGNGSSQFITFGSEQKAYNLSGTIGVDSPYVGLRSGSVDGLNHDWRTITWSGSNITSTYKVQIKARGVAGYWPDDLSNYINPVTGDTSWYDITTNSGSLSLHSTFNEIPGLSVIVQVVGDGLSTPVLESLSIQGLALSNIITLDTEAPTSPALTSPADNSWDVASRPTFDWNASTDSVGIKKYQIYVNDILDKDNIGSGTTASIPTNVLNQGSNTWKIRAVDWAGNYADSVVRTVGYDDQDPSLVLDPSFTFTASDTNNDNILIDWSEYSDGGSPVLSYSVERLKYNSYVANGYNIDSSWSGAGAGSGYYNYDDLTETSITETIGENPQNIEASVKYIYRIWIYDVAGNTSQFLLSDTGLTADVQDPTNPSSVTATACDGTLDKCSDIANNGKEIKLAWTASVDTGTGVTGYKIYRKAESNSINSADFTIVGYLDVVTPGSPVSTVWYDSDTNNNAAYTDTINNISTSIKSATANGSLNLNDYVDYYYRIVAIDATGNQTDIVTTESSPPYVANTVNFATTKTPDVTSPSTPADLTVTAMGIDDLNNNPATQGVNITWSASTDARSVGRTPTGIGSGVKEYELYRAEADVNGPTGEFALITTTTSANYNDTGRSQNDYYYYKIKSVDNVLNKSAFSGQQSVLTLSSAVPSTPSAVSVVALKGDPNTNENVGKQVTVTFTGSKIKDNVNSITGYQVYRSTTNHVASNDWLDATKASLVKTFTVTVAGDVQDTQRSFTEDIPNDATTYYYKVRAVGNNSSSGTVYSGFSTISAGTLNIGWDTVPDSTSPSAPQEVKVKDIHGDGTSMLRNIITWLSLNSDDSQNKRAGGSDFKEYRVYRYSDAVNRSDLTLISTKTALGDNYHVDGISLAEADRDYYYYVVAVDNAVSEFKYANGTVINQYANVSSSLAPVSINPAAAKPTVSTSSIVVKDSNVSSATIEWNTNQQTDSLVEYREKGATKILGTLTDRSEPTTSHSVKLQSLSKGTTYEYRIVSRNALGNIDETAASTWKEFSTQDFSITNVSVSVTTTTATVKWTTPIEADSSVIYTIQKEGKAEESATAGDDVMTREHQVTLKALKPDTNYTYTIRSITGDKYPAELEHQAFKTKRFDVEQFLIDPKASNVAEKNITATSAKIAWNTAVATTSWLDYGTVTGVYSQSAGDEKFNTAHIVELNNLTPGTTYYYRVRGIDANDIEYTSNESTFTAVLTPEISNIKLNEVTSYAVTITFDTNVDVSSFVGFGESTAYGAGISSNTFQRNHSIRLENLEDNKEYHYQIVVKDKLGNEVKSTDAIFNTPLDTTGPVVKEVKIDTLPMGTEDESSSAIISWTTDKPATTQIEYDEGIVGNNFSQFTIPDSTLNRAHTVIIKELIPGTSYKFRVIAKDKKNNLTKSQIFNFVTPTKEKSILQLIIRSLEETFSWVKDAGRKLGQTKNKIFRR